VSAERDSGAPDVSEQEWVSLGAISRPHGVRGELRVHLFNADSELLTTLSRVHLRDAQGKVTAFAVRSARRAPKTWLLALDGITTPEAAEALRDHEVCISRDEMPAPAEDEFYLRDAVGLPVVRGGEKVGEVLEVMLYPSMECLRCRFADGIREVPVMRPWVEGVDIEAGEVRVGDLDDLPLEKLGEA
jgi:16S rRNA processing protein RimM